MKNLPPYYVQLQEKCAEIGFTQPSDVHIGSLLRTLMASKPGGRFLEMGTGIGLSLSWMVDGLGSSDTAHLISLDNDANLMTIANEHFGDDERVTLICTDGADWLRNYQKEPFDLIFADTWPGKFYETAETLDLVAPGGFYIIDDMRTRDDWPDGHQQKVDDLLTYLKRRDDFTLTNLMDWSTGVFILTKLVV